MRTETRRTLFYYLEVRNLKDKSLVGSLADITPRGCLIITEYPAPEGTELLLQVKLPPGGALEEERLRFKAMIRWIKQDKNRPIFYMGLCFTKKESRTDLVIDRLIEQFGFSDGLKKIQLNGQVAK